jgi:dinuclear metal center YbgI/SA1388 family protein
MPQEGNTMKCSEIIEHLEQLSPPSFAEEWDNVGLLAGRRDKEVQRIYIALDATDEVVDDAVRCGADMLLTHHPLIFRPMKKITDDDFIGRRIVRLLQADISYYAMHTNFDIMGMADAAADDMKLENREVLSVTYEDEISREGIGRTGILPRKMTLMECAEYVKGVFRIPAVRVYGDEDTEITRVAVCPGSGKSVLEDAVKLKAEVLITGDIDHHEALDAMAQGLSIIDAGHYGIEKIFIPYMQDYIRRELPVLQIFAAREKQPYMDI